VVAVRAPTTTATTPPPPATPVSLDLATQLEAQGHGLLESGSYSGAVAVLRRALLATGEDVSGCVEPASTMCLTYAYALYDLGRALRLSGDPAAAVPVLERRLEIDNQRPTVLAELELARQGGT
jgi:tetratricopeptide (TPR) repeat protein